MESRTGMVHAVGAPDRTGTSARAGVERQSFTRRRVGLLGIRAGALAWLAGCGPGQAQQPAVSSTGPVELTLWRSTSAVQSKAWTRLLDEWQAKQPQTKISQEEIDDWRTKFATAVAAGTTPDIGQELGSGTQVKFANGWYEPLTRVYQGAKVDPKKYFYWSAYEPWEFKGAPHGVPFEDTGPGFGMVLRTDFLTEVGAAAPSGRYKSWDEAYDLGRKLVRRGEKTRWGWSTRANWLLLWIGGAMVDAGQEYYDKTKQKFQFTTPVGIDVLKKLIWDPPNLHAIEPPEGFRNYEESIKVGDVAMAIGSQAVLRNARTEGRDSAPFLDYVVRPPFKGNEPTVVGHGGWGVCLFRGSQKKEPASAFLQHLISPKGQTTWITSTDCYATATAAVYESPEFNTACQQQPAYAYMKNVWTAQRQGKMRYFGNEAGSPNDYYSIVNRITDELRASKLAPRQAAEQLDEQMNVKLGEYKASLGATGK